MTGAVLGRIADVHHIERAPIGFALPFDEGGTINHRHAIAPGDGIGALPRSGGAFGRHLRCTPIGARHDLEASEVPRHRAILQGDDAVRHAGVDQGLRADDAARPPTAIDDDKRVGRRHELVEAIDELGARDANRARDTVGVVFLVGAAVEDRELLAAFLPVGELLGTDPGRAVVMFDDFGEGLARHVHAAIDGKAGRRPCRDAALQDRDIVVAAGDQPPCSALGQTFAVIADDDWRRAAWQQRRGEQFEAGER